MITVKNKICFIRRYTDRTMEMNRYTSNQRFKLIIAKIKKITYGVRKSTVSSDHFHSLGIDELESNTTMINKEKGIFLVNEPFIIDNSDIHFYEEVVRRWNECPPTDLWEG